MTKRRILFVLSLMMVLLIAGSAYAGTKTLFNYPHLYRGTRSMGMGGTYVAVGGDSEALFYNPAALKDMGFKLNLINPIADIDKNALDLGTDIQDGMNADTEQDRLNDMTDIINNNMGKPLHLRVGVFPSVAVNNLAVGVLGQANIDGRLHNPLGSSGALEINGGAEYGPVAGFSYGLPYGFRVGLGAKYIMRSWINQNFTVSQIASDTFNFDDYLTDKSDFSFDAGLLYEVPLLEFLKPKVGLSVMDITDLDFGDAGIIPMHINLGIAIAPKVPYLGEITVAADYEDITKQYEQDASTWKRVHLGAEVAVLDRHINLRAGINQGYPTFGAELDIWVIKLAYTFYQEEMGAYAGQDEDSRHMAYLSIGWR